MRKRVLIVEDEPSIVASLEFLMQRCGYETRVVMDGDGVMSEVAAFAPDLVLLDIMLRGRSGFDVCREIRDRHAATRILLLTAMGGKGGVALGMAAGADDYVTKPFSTHDLVDRVRVLVDGAPAGNP